MPTQIRIPTPLRKLTNEEEVVETAAGNVGAAIDDLDTRFPGIRERLLDESGELRHFVNIYVNDDDIRYLDKEATTVKDGDTLSIVPSVAGGDDE